MGFDLTPIDIKVLIPWTNCQYYSGRNIIFQVYYKTDAHIQFISFELPNAFSAIGYSDGVSSFTYQ